MTTFDVANLINIFDNICCSIIGCFFLYQLKRDTNIHQRKAATSFFRLYMCWGIAFGVMAMREWFPLTVSVLLSNSFYTLSFYLLLFGIFHWYEIELRGWQKILSGCHIVLFSLSQLALLIFVEGSFVFRVYFAAVNYLPVLMYTFHVLRQNKHRNGYGEKLLSVAVFLLIPAVILPSVAVTWRESFFYFQSAIQVGQSIASYFMLGALLSLFLFDQIDKHYQSSVRDELTGLYNRRYFWEHVQKYAKSARQHFMLTIIDIDYFKQINDEFGHDIGDLTIQNVAKVIQQQISQEDVVARYGGDEFILFLPDKSQEEVAAMLDSIRMKISETCIKKTGEELVICISISVGYANIKSGETVDEVMKRADIALYKAKHSGRNKIILAEDSYPAESLCKQPDTLTKC